MNYIFYQTKTKFTNTGDVLINKALIEELRNYGKLKINCSEDIPKSFISELGVREEEKLAGKGEISFAKKVLMNSIFKKKTDKVYLFSGLGDSYGGNICQVFRNVVSSIILATFRMAGVQVVRIGRSVGPLTKSMQISERFRNLFLSYNYVRDSISLERCWSYGIKTIMYCPDMSWLYDINGIRNVNSTNIIMVNLRNSIYNNTDADFVNATLCKLDSLLEIFKLHYGFDMQVMIASQTDDDMNFSKMIYTHLEKKYKVIYIDHQMRLNELEKYYSMCDFHISNRMHSLFLGYKYGSLPIALIDRENHTKISATLKDCGLEELTIDIYSKNIKLEVDNLIFHKDNIINKLFNVEIEMQKKVRDQLERIFKS